MSIEMIANIVLSFAISAGILTACGIAIAWCTTFSKRSISIKSKEIEAASNTEKSIKEQSELYRLTNEMQDCILHIVSNVVILKWREYEDSHNMSRITRAQVSELVKECAKTIKDVIDIETIDFDTILCTSEYIDFLIVNSVIFNIKKMLDEVDLVIDE